MVVMELKLGFVIVYYNLINEDLYTKKNKVYTNASKI